MNMHARLYKIDMRGYSPHGNKIFLDERAILIIRDRSGADQFNLEFI